MMPPPDERAVLTDTLNVPAGEILLVDMSWLLWGQTLSFTCRYQGETPFTFIWQFEDCREMRWQQYSHNRPATPTAFPPSELVSLRVGKGKHRKPAQLLTVYFGLSLLYGEMTIRRD